MEVVVVEKQLKCASLCFSISQEREALLEPLMAFDIAVRLATCSFKLNILQLRLKKFNC